IHRHDQLNFYSPVTSQYSLIQRRIVWRGSQHLIPRSQAAHDFEPQIRKTIEFKHRGISFLKKPGFLIHLAFKLSRSPARIAYKCANCNYFFWVNCVACFLETDIVIELKPFALVPFERCKHQLIFPHRSAEKNGHLSKSPRWRLGDEIGYLSVEWAIDDDTQSPLAWVMLGNEKHRASEIRIEHIRMSDQQLTSKS